MRENMRVAAFVLWMVLSSATLPAAAQALTPRLGVGLAGYDYASVGWGALAAAVGGLGRTAVMLLLRDMAVLSVAREAVKDLLLAALAGTFAYVFVAAVMSYWPVPVPVVVAVLVAVGWAGSGAFAWAEKAGQRIADGAVSSFIRRLGGSDYTRESWTPGARQPDELPDGPPPRRGGLRIPRTDPEKRDDGL